MNIYKTKKLLEINKMLTQSLKLEEILHHVIVAARALIDVSDVLIIYLYDKEANKLKFAKGEGVDKEQLKKVAFSPGESITGKIFTEKKSKLFTSEQEIDEYMENMTDENYRHYYEGVRRRKIRSMFCVPIINKGRCLGVVAVNNYNQNGVFTEEDMQVIKVVADQSAIAIDNANVYKNLKEKNTLLKRSIAIHNQFYQLIIEGRGIKNIISLLERMISSPVVFYTHVNERDEANAFPIRRGDDILGVLMLGRPFPSFSEMDQIAIEQASLSIALELIKDNAIYEKEIHFREQVFNQLLEGKSGSDLQHALRYVKWDEDWIVQCMILEGRDHPLWEAERLIDKERFVKSIERISSSVGLHSLIFTRAFQLIMIIPKFKQKNIKELINGIQTLWKNEKDIYYGVGRETTIHDLSISYKEALRSIGYAKLHNVQIVEYAKLGIERLLYEVDKDILDMFMNDQLQQLYNLDESFIDTLRIFIELNKNHKKTAEMLHIHSNTLYYRLKKIEEVLQIEFNNEKDWIDLVIAFRLYVASNKKDE
ncbi:helix-turn-helix domain-containing protein [Siminovitchia fortis]|uniref:helix-turn-helix domain-containing protein n=1 Tax=Siminovitchia fortis TaxID=254758 RepID=UPI00119F303C|nr:GAF domain-containing protein [Siminovitchia fortis]